MSADALTACQLLPAGHPAREPAALARGCSLMLLGRTAEAVPFLEEASSLGEARPLASILALVGQGQQGTSQLITVLEDTLPSDTMEQLRPIIESITNVGAPGIGLVIGLLVDASERNRMLEARGFSSPGPRTSYLPDSDTPRQRTVRRAMTVGVGVFSVLWLGFGGPA